MPVISSHSVLRHIRFLVGFCLSVALSRDISSNIEIDEFGAVIVRFPARHGGSPEDNSYFDPEEVQVVPRGNVLAKKDARKIKIASIKLKSKSKMKNMKKTTRLSKADKKKRKKMKKKQKAKKAKKASSSSYFFFTPVRARESRHKRLDF